MKSRNLDLGLYHSVAKASDQTIAAEMTLSAGLTIHAEGIETYVVGELITNKWCRKFHHAHKAVVK